MSHAVTGRTRLAAATTALVLCAGIAAPVAQETRVNRDAQLIADFNKRVEEYAEVHRKADAALPEVSNSATSEQVDAHQRALAQAIGRTRGSARAGDIFTRDIRAYFRRQISRPLSGPEGAQIRDAIMEENPGAIQLRINGRYPDTVPVTTMPPQILAALPKLPKELEYRFIGQRLVLLDVHGQLVVDFIEDSIPK
jgi:hypothetical protein